LNSREVLAGGDALACGEVLKEEVEITAVVLDSLSVSGEERPHVVGSIRTGIQVPGITSNRKIGNEGYTRASGGVTPGNGTSVEVNQPDHDLVHVRPTG